MTETKKQKLTEILQKLKTSGDFEGAAVITRDGLSIASELSPNINANTLAAMSATMTGAAETAVQELNKASPERVIVESNNSKLITVGAGPKAILVCVIGSRAKLGLILISMKKAAASIKNIVK